MAIVAALIVVLYLIKQRFDAGLTKKKEGFSSDTGAIIGGVVFGLIALGAIIGGYFLFSKSSGPGNVRGVMNFY